MGEDNDNNVATPGPPPIRRSACNPVNKDVNNGAYNGVNNVADVRA